MRTAVLVCVLLAVVGTRAVAQQDEKPVAKPVQKGDSLRVTGCLAGGALEATESEALESSGVLVGGLTFRLTGDKALLKQLRDKYDRQVVAVTGVLKSALPQQEGQSRTVGRTRITIGGATPNPNSPHAENRRALPVLEVKSFDGVATISCGR